MGQPAFGSGVAAWGDYDGDQALDLLVSYAPAVGTSVIYHNCGCADLTATVAPMPDPAQPDAPLTYGVTLHNGGPQTAYTVRAVRHPAGRWQRGRVVRRSPAASCQVLNGKPTLTVNTLPAQATLPMTITMTTPTRWHVDQSSATQR